MYIVFDTETTGKAKNFNAPFTDFDNWPRMVQLAWIVYDKDGNKVSTHDYIIKPDGFEIPLEVVAIHGITTEKAEREGKPLKQVLDVFRKAISENDYLIAHNITFDEGVVGCEYARLGEDSPIVDIEKIDTVEQTKNFCKLPGKGEYKFPKLEELHFKVFGKYFQHAHNALYDVDALGRCFFELQRIGYLGFKEKPFKKQVNTNYVADLEITEKPIVHFGVHTFHSILQGAGTIDAYIEIAKKLGHNSIGICDTGTFSGSFEFYKKCKANNVKPIYAAELYLNDGVEISDENYEEDVLQKIIVKNEQGYKNLNKLIFLSHTRGNNGNRSRITTNWLIENKEGLIITTSCIRSKMASYLSKGRKKDAKDYFLKLEKEFGENLIMEIKFNEFDEQKKYNQFILNLASEYKKTVILDNNIHYAYPQDATLQDTLAAIKQQRPIKSSRLLKERNLYYVNRRGYLELNAKFGFNYPKEILELFMDNSNKIAEKCNFTFVTGVERYPKYEPEQDVIDYFKTNDTKEIITKLSSLKLEQKIKERIALGEVELKEKIPEYKERLRYELEVIEQKGMLDYFMVNWEMLKEYRKSGNDTGAARGCFYPGSRVKMSDGFFAPIETIEIGEYVVDAFGEIQKVLNTLEYEIKEDTVELEFEGGRKIKCTTDHEILTKNRGWVKAIDLTEKDDICEI